MVIKDNENETTSAIEKLFRMFAGAAMSPKPYVKKTPLPATVTVTLAPQEMEILQLISARIGAARGNVAYQILKFGLYEAAYGCGFTPDEEGNIPEEQKKWDLQPRTMGFSFTGGEEA